MRNNILIVSILVLGFGSVVFAAPYFRQEASLVPIDATENIGTSTAPWDELHVNEICLSADCKTVWPTGGSGGTGTVSTSTNETAGRVPYWTTTSGTPAKLGEIATSSVTINAPLTSAGTAGFVLGGSGWTIDIDDIKAADLDLTDITLNDFTNDAGFLTTVDISDDTNLAATWPIVLTGDTLSTAFSTTTNSGMSAGNLYVGSGGIFQTAASSSIFGYTPLNPTRQLTVAGTANQITSSAGAQDLSADRTWTLSFPNHLIFPGNFQATNSTTTNATTTSLYVTGAFASTTQFYAHGLASCTGDNYLTWSGGVFGCAADDTTTGAADFTFESNYGALNAATSSILWAKSGINASSTSHFVNASTSLLTVGNMKYFDEGIPSWVPNFASGDRDIAIRSIGTGEAYLTDSTFNDYWYATTDELGGYSNDGRYFFGNGVSNNAILDASPIASSDKTFTFPNLTGSFALGSYATGFTDGHIPFGSSGLLATSSSLTFDGTTFTTNAATFNATTTHTAAQFGSTAIGNNVVKVTPLTGLDISASESAGGMVLFDTGATDEITLAVHNNHAGSSRNLSVVCNNASYSGNCLHVRSESSASAVNIAGAPEGQGLIKAASDAVGDANASIMSLDASTGGFLGQLFFFKCGTSLTCWNMRDANNNQNLTAFWNANFGWGTTTPYWQVQIASSTGPQLTLTDNAAAANQKHWTFRSRNGNLYIATSSDSYATSTNAALSINTNGTLTVSGGGAAITGVTSISPGAGTFTFNSSGQFVVPSNANPNIAANSNTGLFVSTTVLSATMAGTDVWRIDSTKRLGIGTSTPQYLLTVASSTAPQIALSAGAGFAQWTQRNSFGTLYFATTTVAGTATSTTFGLRIDSDGKIVGWDATNKWTGTISPTRYFDLGAGTTTTWTATTSGEYVPQIVMPFAGTLRQTRCTATSSAAFLGVSVYINTTKVSPAYFVASSTEGLITFTANNTFSAGDVVRAYFGTSTQSTSNRSVDCTFGATET